MKNWQKFTEQQPDPGRAIITRNYLPYLDDYTYSVYNPRLKQFHALFSDSVEWSYVPAEKSFSSADIVRVGLNSYINGAQHCNHWMEQSEFMKEKYTFEQMVERYKQTLEEEAAKDQPAI